jgi:hypothetical protein
VDEVVRQTSESLREVEKGAVAEKSSSAESEKIFDIASVLDSEYDSSSKSSSPVGMSFVVMMIMYTTLF